MRSSMCESSANVDERASGVTVTHDGRREPQSKQRAAAVVIYVNDTGVTVMTVSA